MESDPAKILRERLAIVRECRGIIHDCREIDRTISELAREQINRLKELECQYEVELLNFENLKHGLVWRIRGRILKWKLALILREAILSIDEYVSIRQVLLEKTKYAEGLDHVSKLVEVKSLKNEMQLVLDENIPKLVKIVDKYEIVGKRVSSVSD